MVLLVAERGVLCEVSIRHHEYIIHIQDEGQHVPKTILGVHFYLSLVQVQGASCKHCFDHNSASL